MVLSPAFCDTAYLVALVGEDRLASLCAAAGIGPGVPDRLDMLAFWRCCAENIRLGNDESHGCAAAPVPIGSLSLLVMAAKEADTLEQALHRLAEAARLVRREVQITLGHRNGVLRASFAPAIDPPDGPARRRMAVYCECFAIVIHCALRWMTGRRLDPVAVRGDGALRALGGELLLALGARVARRGRWVSIDYARADADAPVLPRRYTAWGEAEFESFVAMVAEGGAHPQASDHARVIEAMRGGRHSQDQVAAWMGMSVATLRRRLTAANLSFREISADFRTHRLKDLLAGDMPLADVAEALGLSDERSLRRFCSEHLGMAPAAWRTRAQT